MIDGGVECWNLRFGEGKRGELDEEMGGQKKGERKGEEENPRRGLMSSEIRSEDMLHWWWVVHSGKQWRSATS